MATEDSIPTTIITATEQIATRDAIILRLYTKLDSLRHMNQGFPEMLEERDEEIKTLRRQLAEGNVEVASLKGQLKDAHEFIRMIYRKPPPLPMDQESTKPYLVPLNFGTSD